MEKEETLISFSPLSEKTARVFHLHDVDLNEKSEEEDSFYDRFSRFEQLCSRVPSSHFLVGELEYEIPHSPGLTWDVHSAYFIGPAEREEMDWLLYCIDWDDNWGCYEVRFLAECKGYESPKLAAIGMLSLLFKKWLEDEPDSHPGWRFIANLKESGI